MKNWDELRTAYKVASLGKVTLAAQALGVHRSTVIRQIDALEHRLGVRLFDRDKHGYTPTLEGEELLRVIGAAEKQFGILEQRLSKTPVTRRSSLKVTSVDALSLLLVPIVRRFCFQHPDIQVTFVNTEDFLQLEYGEADIAIRPGAPPKASLYTFETIEPVRLGLYATQKLKAKHGVTEYFEQAGTLPFVRRHGRDKTAFETWMSRTVPARNIVYQSSCVYALKDIVVNGLAAGFLPRSIARKMPDLSEIKVASAPWEIPLYVALNAEEANTKNHSLFLDHLKSEAY